MLCCASDCDWPGAGAFGSGIPAFWNWLFCLPLCLRLFRCASASGIAAMAIDAIRIKALRRICALMEGFCFFIEESSGMKLREAALGGTCGSAFLEKSAETCQDFFRKYVVIFR